MVAVPSALYLAAGLLAVAVSAGLATALLSGVHGPSDAASPRWLRLVGGTAALVYGLSHALAGAQIGPVEVWSWLHAAGLAGIAVGAAPAHLAALSRLPLIIPVAPVPPSYAAAAMGLVAAVRVGLAGRGALPAAAGLVALGAGHALAPAQPTWGAAATVLGALLLGVWLVLISRRRILAKLLTAFVAALLAMAILLAAVLSTVSAAQLTTDELDRLGRLADQLTQDIRSWPAEAIAAAQPLSRSVGPLLATTLEPAEAAELYEVSLGTQDFFLTLDAAGTAVNSHPAGLPGSLRLALAGDPLVADVRSGASDSAGGLLASGQVVAFGAVAVRSPDARPEDPPAGVLVTGRVVDDVWAARQASTLDVGLVGVVGGQAVFASDAVEVAGEEVLAGLAGRPRADLSVGEAVLFAAAAPLADPERGTPLGQVIATSTPEVIAAVERTQAQRLFLVTLIGGVLAVLLAYLITRRSLRPIGRLTAVAERVGGGDLEGRAAIDSPDEVGALGGAFDAMVASLATQQADLSSAAEREAGLRGRLQSLTDSMGDGLVAVDPGGEVITFNPAAEALTGLPGDAVIGRPLTEVLQAGPLAEGATQDGAPGQGALGLGDVGAQTVTTARLLLTRGDGTLLPVAATAAPVRAPDGTLIGRVYVLRDIARDLEVEVMKSQFLANVSHELRTPITPIKGYASVLARRDVGAEATQRYAGQILDSTSQLERIIGMIVEFAGLDSGRVRLRREAVDLVPLIDRTLGRWRTSHPDRVISSRVQAPLPPVFGDPDYLCRCLDELLDNAIKFSPDGEDVVVAAHRLGETVLVDVIDAGVGIRHRAAATLFSDFVQADGTETRHFGGLGLGLGLVKRILDGIGAEVRVVSEPGEGSTFSLVLDVAGPVPLPPLPAPPLPRGVVPPPPPPA